jgi:hypothetical protein
MALASCTDLGDPLSPSPPPPPPPDDPSGPALTDLDPARTYIGDRVTLRGMRFGTDALAGDVLFAGPTGDVPALVESWANDEIVTRVPAGSISGDVRVQVEGEHSAGLPFQVAPEVSYATDLVPLFLTYGCVSCHGGINNLEVTPYASLLAGTSDNGPVIVPGDRMGSLLFRKINPAPPMGVRMPQGGPYLSSGEIQRIGDWIDQGARDN